MDYYELGEDQAALIKQRFDLALAGCEAPVKASCFCRMNVAA